MIETMNIRAEFRGNIPPNVTAEMMLSLEGLLKKTIRCNANRIIVNDVQADEQKIIRGILQGCGMEVLD